MEEVGHPGEGQEEDLGSHSHHLHSKREQAEGIGHHWGLPRKEGGAVDDARAPAVRDGARGIV